MMTTVKQDATLYADGNALTINSCSLSCYKAETQCVALLAAYCGKLNMDLVLVVDTETLKKTETANKFLKVPKSCFNTISVKPLLEVPSSIKDCHLPAVCTSDKMNIYSGLCTVLRYIVKRASHLASSSLERTVLLSLLGHRMYCLKACSEVSPRTKLCEVLMPSIINNWEGQQGYDRKNGLNESIVHPIAEFEHLMCEPVVIHNMDKRQRVLLQRLEAEKCPPLTGKQRRQKTIVWTKDLPRLEHAFAEGVDFTLTDICLLPSIHFFLSCTNSPISKLNGLVPKTLKWYKRVKAIGRLEKSFIQCDADLIELSELPDEIALTSCSTQVLELRDTRKEPPAGRDKINKKELEITIRRDLPALLKKLSSNGITPQFSTLDTHEIVAWSELQKELHPTEGELDALRAQRKCQQIENFVAAVKKTLYPGDRIVDFCSGGGHVGIVLAAVFPESKVILVENKEESLERARARISALNLKNISTYQCNLEFYRGDFDIGVGLHACGVASDMIVQLCVSRKASFILSPCCYGKVRNCHWITYPQSKLFRNISISFQENLLLGHAADCTSWNFDSKHAKTGKLCMGLVDLDRISAAEERGYEVEICTMQPYTCTPKNNLLIGRVPVTKHHHFG